MPAIHLFQRRTLYGGDDLHLFAITTAAVRACQLACYGVLVRHIVYHVQHQQQGNPYTSPNVWRDHSQDVYLPSALSSVSSSQQRQDEQQPYSKNHGIVTFGLDVMQYALLDPSGNCRHSHLFPLLLMTFTAAGIVFCVASFVLLAQIYYWSSQGCPTVHRHPRTLHMERLLEWILWPCTILHAMIFLGGASALGMAYVYAPCDDTIAQASSPLMKVLWIAAAVLILASQGLEIVWNFWYVANLYYANPHALALDWARAAAAAYTPAATTDGIHADYAQDHDNHHPSDAAVGGTYHYQTHGPNNNQHFNNNSFHPHSIHQNHELLEEMWVDRMHNCCQCLGFGTCYMFGGRELYGTGASHYGDIARALADYMETKGTLDVVPSDLMAGFLVLQQVQQVRRHSQRALVLSEHEREMSKRTAATTTSSSTIDGSSRSAFNKASILRQGSSSFDAGISDHITSATTNALVIGNGGNNGINVTSLATGSFHTAYPNGMSPQPSPFRMPASSNTSPFQQQASIQTSSVLHARIHHSIHSPPPPQDPLRGTTASSVHSERRHPKGFHRVLDPENPMDLRLVVDGARYSKYALAIYTWYLYLYVHPVTGIPRLLAKSWASACGGNSHNCSCAGCFFRCNNSLARRTSAASMISRAGSSGGLQDAAANNNSFQNTPSPSSSPTHTSARHGHNRRNHNNGRWEGDNICQAHKHALLLTAGLEDEADLVYVQLKSSLNENPYCILLDHEKQVVVVSVRGTFSLEDCVNDVLLEPESLEQIGHDFGFGDVAKGQHCHGGILLCARNIHRDLQRHGWLEYLLETKYPQYHLRLVGHSLGAACATLLGYMLRPKYPTLQTFNFSPPGCTFSWDIAVDCQPWCTSFVMDTELVPRLSFDALEQLRDECLELIGRIKVSKIEVARRVAAHTMLGGCGSRYRAPHNLDIERALDNDCGVEDLLDDLLFKPDEIPAEASSYRQQLDQFRMIQSERRSTRGLRRAVKLYPPGTMLHLVKTDEVQACWVKVAKCITLWATNAGSQYTPVWIGNADLNEIVVSPTMGTDHFPDRMVNELRGIVQGYGLLGPL